MKISFFTLLITCFLSVFAQQSINTQAFFEMGLSKLEQAENLVNASPKNLQFPWIEDVQFRTESRDFEWRQQEYTLRVSPSSFKKRKALKNFSNYLHQKPDFEGQEIYCNALSDLYADWLALYLIQDNLLILNNLGGVLEDEQKVYQKMLGALEVDLEKMVRLQTDKSDLSIAAHELQLEQQFLFKKYGLENVALDFADLVTVEGIAATLRGSKMKVDVLEEAEFAYKKELLAKELELEKAEKRQVVDFMQMRYRGPHDDNLNEKVAVGLGLQFPNSGNQKLKMAELQLEQQELEREQERKQIEQEKETNQVYDLLLLQLEGYGFYQKTTAQERNELQNLSTLIAQQEGFNPLLLLDIEERNLETQMELLKKRESILYDFLDYLEESGKLCKDGNEEFVNYLLK